MTRRLPLLCISLALASQAGCALYNSGDDDCLYGDFGGAIAAELLRDPDTGICQDFGYGGGGGPCGEALPGDRAPAPDWGACDSSCTGLGEYDCMATPGCRAVFADDCPADGSCSPTTGTFFECWAIAPSGPAAPANCAALDAYDCSRHDDCSAVHYRSEVPPGADQPGFVNTVGSFAACAAEPVGCYGDEDCGPGASCNAAELCLPPPGCGGSGGGACPAVCYGFCEPDQSVHCYGEVACDAAPPACPDGSVPGIRGACWSGDCIPAAECPEGTCDQALCEAVEPTCPPGSVPGVVNGCYTGACIPAADCPAPPACPLLDELGCVSRSDCAPLYQGVGCTCAGGACTCDDWQFTSCETR